MFSSLPVQYNAMLGSEDIPSSMLPDVKTKMIPCTSNLKSVRTSSANIGAGSLALFQLNTGAGTGYLKSNSVYLRGSVTLTLTNGGGTWRFTGPQNVHSASALINRLTVSNGSQMLSQLTNYNSWHDILLSHATSRDYIEQDSTLYEGTGVIKTYANPATTFESTLNFSIPLMSPVFNSSQFIPLFLLNAPLTVEVLFNSIADAIQSSTATTAYIVNDLQIVYEELAVSPELKQSIRDRMQSGSMWKQYLDSVYSINTSSTSGLSFNLGVGLSSCKGVLVADRQNAVGVVGQFILNRFSNARFYFDGRLINNFDLTTDAVVYSELNRTLNSIYDSDRTSSLGLVGVGYNGAINKTVPLGVGFDTASTDFCTQKFIYGVSAQSVNDFSVGFSGQPVQMIVVQTFNDGGADNVNFPPATQPAFSSVPKVMFVLYDELLTIDANGVCSLIR